MRFGSVVITAGLVVYLLIVASACSTAPFAGPAGPAAPPEADPPANSYYYFTEAHLARARGDRNTAVDFLDEAIAMAPDSNFLKRELASVYMEMGQAQQAADIMTQVLAEEPENVDSLILFGKISQMLKKNGQAKRAYEKVIELDPLQESAYSTLARIYLNEDNMADALRVFRKLTEHFPASFVGHFFVGKIQAEQGELDAAVKAFEKSLQLEPELLESRFELIQIYNRPEYRFIDVEVSGGETLGAIAMRLYGEFNPTVEKAVRAANPGLKDPDVIRAGQQIRFPTVDWVKHDGGVTESIVRLYREILEISPDNVRAAVELGIFFLRAGKGEEARPLFEELAARVQNEKAVMNTIVQQYFEKKRYEDIELALTEILRYAPLVSDIHYVLGLALSELDKPEQALSHFLEVKVDSDFFTNAAVNIAYVYQRTGNIDAAVAYLEKALAEMPENVDFMLYLGTFYEDMAAYDKAEDILKRGLSIDPENARLQFRLGIVYDKQGRKDECIEAMKAVIRMEPDNATALNYLGYTYAEMGIRLDEADRLVRKALELRPDDGYITDSLGWVYFRRGMFEKAREILERAIELVPNDPVILEHLGDVYRELGSRDKALELYRRSLEKREPDDRPEIEEKMRQLKTDGTK